MARVELEDLTKRYGDVTAVENASLTIEDDEFVTFVGPSGCGKTTTLRLIAGFEMPTSGAVRLDGTDITHLKPYQRNVGMVFQSFALFPHMSVFDNIAYGLREDTDRSEAAIEDKVSELLELIQLPGIGDRDPSELSGGQQQRVALARALAIEPEVLLLDEPLASLDKKLREEMQVELRQLHEELEFTTIFVTHNQREAMSMSDRIVVMDQGRVQQVGAPEDVYRNPSSTFVADFIGSSNLFEVEVLSIEDGRTRVMVGEDLELLADSEPMSKDAATISVRPEAIQLSDKAPDDPNEFECQVEFKRYLGTEIEYHLSRGSLGIEAIVQAERSGNEFEKGETVTAEIAPSSIHVLSD